MNFKRILLFIIAIASILSSPTKSYGEQLSIGQSITVYLNPSIPSGGWITSADWSTDVIGLNCFNGGTWGTGLKVDGYWSDIATLSCNYTYSYYGINGDINVGHSTECWFYTCQGYPVSISPTSVTLDKGEKATLTFKITGAKLGSLAARWVSSDTNVASVYADGDYTAIVTAKYPGTCIITCYSYMGEPVECFVKVNSFPPTSITLSPTEAEVVQGKTIQLRCNLLPNGASATYTWQSDNPSIATVQNGKVTGVSAGKTKIRVSTDNGLTAASEVTVISNAPTSVALSPAEASVLQGKTVKLTPSITPDYASTTYAWKSDNTSIATVQNGVVTGVSGGKTKIWVSTENGLSTSSEVTVIPRPVSSSLSGDGTQESPYIIASAADLRYLSDKVNAGNSFEGKHFKQTDNIVINTAPYDSDEFKTQELWIPIGKNKDYPFKGIYDGDNHVISGIYITDTPDNEDFNIGLFGWTKNATLQNIIIENTLIDIYQKWIAAIVGYAEGSSKNVIDNCHVFNSYIKCDGGFASGVVGNGSIPIRNCSNSATVNSSHRAAGIVVTNKSYNVYNCLNYGKIEGSNGAAGIINYTYGDILNCYNSGTVHSNVGFAAGILGVAVPQNTGHKINNCVNYGAISTNTESFKPSAIIYQNQKYGITYNVNNCYYLDTCIANGITDRVNMYKVKSVTETEMKSAATLEALNKKADEEGYCKWVAGADGFPTFEWYEDVLDQYNDFVAYVDDIRQDEISVESFRDLPDTAQITVYTLSGVCIYKGIKSELPDLKEGYYIAVTPHKTFKLYQ